MAIRNIRINDDPILRKKSRTVTDFDNRLFQLLDDMKDTLYKAEGCGLAAVQIGVLKRIVVVDCGDGFLELINPEIISTDGEQREAEGCLSIPERGGITVRPEKVRLRAQNRQGNWCMYQAEGLKARCFCHETDHLDGILFTDKLAPGEKIYKTK